MTEVTVDHELTPTDESNRHRPLRLLLPALLLLGAGTAQAQSLNFINGGGPLHGSNTAVVIQGEGSCSHKRQSPPTLGVGVGVAQPLMLPGSYGHGTAYLRLPLSQIQMP